MVASQVRRCALVLTLLLVAGCGGALQTVGLRPRVEVPPDAAEYTTSSGSNGVRGGDAAREARDILATELEARGDDAEPDAALAATAAWRLRAAYAREDVSTAAATDAGYRFGFAGMLLGLIVGPLSEGRTKSSLQELVAQVPKNLPINRYGIVAGQGTDVVVVIGAVEASLEDFPRALAPGGKLRLEGEIGKRYERASVFSTNPEGAVREIAMTDRAIDASLEFPNAGVYRLEVMGYGATGPVVLVNVPIQVGKATREIEVSSEADPNLTVEAAEATLLSLLNEERRKRGLAPVQADPELRQVALAHSTDMAEHHFMSHVSPTTGSPENRVQKAGLRVSRFGECISLDATPAGSHRGLMDSPAHRAAMIEPLFTHVGIGATFIDSGRVGRRLVATLLFGRRPPPEDAALSADATLDAIHALRKAQKLPPLRLDPVLAAVAGAGARALTNGSAKTSAQALAAAGREMQRQVNRTRVSRNSCQLYVEIIDRDQLASLPLLQRSDITAVGVGVAPLQDETGPKLAVIVLADAGAQKTIACN